ncbi:MAG: CDP-glycerol glycerophosphotransferase family protein [Lachnospiraceae bacterium]|nr:CDP-glycerol glycerophosphotransferase family protein [Lachnospiraceae bacterium]
MISENEWRLEAPEFETDRKRISKKMLKFPSGTPLQILFRKMISLLRRGKVKDSVLFFTIRKDRELEGNLAALYPHVKSKKKIIALCSPHTWLQKLRIYRNMYTSKVIVTDDYNPYLRYFPLKREQRFVQIWHACGAFKKFGLDGTKLKPRTEKATHAQYNMVCVSSEGIRDIYAGAFDVDRVKVCAMGVPRTDMFFGESVAQEIRSSVYAKYPELKDKRIILYAPTFRGVAKEKRVFHPPLDFERISGALEKNDRLVICPHPVMTEKILKDNYDKVWEIREFSTNELMFVSSALITDYSSVIFEYAFMDRPMGFFCYDIEEYDRGFYLDYPEDLPGEVLRSAEDFLRFIGEKDDPQKEKRKAFMAKYLSACDGHSGERIAGIIDKYVNQKEL